MNGTEQRNGEQIVKRGGYPFPVGLTYLDIGLQIGLGNLFIAAAGFFILSGEILETLFLGAVLFVASILGVYVWNWREGKRRWRKSRNYDAMMDLDESEEASELDDEFRAIVLKKPSYLEQLEEPTDLEGPCVAFLQDRLHGMCHPVVAARSPDELTDSPQFQKLREETALRVENEIQSDL